MQQPWQSLPELNEPSRRHHCHARLAPLEPDAEPLVAEVAADGGAVEGLRLAGGDLVLKIEWVGAVVQIRIRGSAPFPEDGGIDIRHRFALRMPPTMGRMVDFWSVAGLPAPRLGRGRGARIGLL